MFKKDILVLPTYYDRYIDLVDPTLDIVSALTYYSIDFIAEDIDKIYALEDKVYQPEKWTTKDIFQHIIDVERVFAYRALRLSRHDKTSLPGFDENEYAIHAQASHRTLEDLFEELKDVRQSTIALYKNCKTENLSQSSIINNIEISVLAIGFTIVGHYIHHIAVLKEKYFPLLTQ